MGAIQATAPWNTSFAPEVRVTLWPTASWLMSYSRTVSSASSALWSSMVAMAPAAPPATAFTWVTVPEQGAVTVHCFLAFCRVPSCCAAALGASAAVTAFTSTSWASSMARLSCRSFASRSAWSQSAVASSSMAFWLWRFFSWNANFSSAVSSGRRIGVRPIR